MDDIIIYGSGGFAREVAQLVDDINQVRPTWRLLGFADDNIRHHGQSVGDSRVIGGVDWVRTQAQAAIVVAIGSTSAKRKVTHKLQGARFATLIHPRAWVGKRVTFGEGCVVCAGVTATCDIRLGAHVILNLSTTVGHDARFDDYVTVAPSVNVSGGVHVGEGCDLGTGSAIIQNVAVGAWSVLGAGAVLVRDLPANTTAVGNPARVIKTREPGWQLV